MLPLTQGVVLQRVLGNVPVYAPFHTLEDERGQANGSEAACRGVVGLPGLAQEDYPRPQPLLRYVAREEARFKQLLQPRQGHQRGAA